MPSKICGIRSRINPRQTGICDAVFVALNVVKKFESDDKRAARKILWKFSYRIPNEIFVRLCK